MSELFLRHANEPFTGKTVKEGRKVLGVVRHMCGRCGGAGRAEQWRFTGYTCYDCGGNGHLGDKLVPLYTAEQIATLNERKAKADEKRRVKAEAKAAMQAEAANARRNDFLLVHGALIERAKPYMESDTFVADVVGRGLTRAELSDKQVAALIHALDKIEAREAARRGSNYIGEIGKRIEAEVTVERVHTFSRPSFNAHWVQETVYIVTMRDAYGNAVVSKSTAFSAEPGEVLVIRATVKDHSEYNGEKQTVVNRVKAQTKEGVHE